MKNFGEKLRLIFFPFLLIVFSTVVIYTFLHWALFINAELFRVDEIILNFVIPTVLTGIPILIWLRPRIKLLKLNTKGRRDPVFFFIFITWVAVAAPTIIAQEYLNTATGKLTGLDNIGQIHQHPLTKYYTLKHAFVDKRLVRIKPHFEVSGRNDEYFHMAIYTPCPIFKDQQAEDTSSGNIVAWLAIKYSKSISNNLSNAEKESAYHEFAKESQNAFDAAVINQFVYLDRINYSSDYKNYVAAINSNGQSSVNNSFIILSPVNEPFENRNGEKLPWIFGSIAIGAVVFLIALLCVPLRSDALKIDLKEQGMKERAKAFVFIRALFSPDGNAQALRILIGLNLLMYIIMVCAGLGFISFSGEDLLNWGANYRPLVLHGQYWRLLTCTFLHGGLMHILFNMYGLFFVGLFLEPVLGSRKFLIAYFITGIVSSIASAWWHPATVSVGASGAIFGMYGVFFALLTVNVFPTEIKKPFLINTLVFIGYNLLMGIRGNIDNAAHIGGLISGIILGYLFYFLFKDQIVQKPKPKKRRSKKVAITPVEENHDVIT